MCNLHTMQAVCQKFNCGINYAYRDKIADLVKLS